MAHATNMQRQLNRLRFTIPASGTNSNGHNIGGMVILGFLMPAAWTAAGINFEASLDGTNWYPIHGDDGNAVVIASGSLAADRFIVNKAILEQLACVLHLRLVSTASQAAARDIEMVLKG